MAYENTKDNSNTARRHEIRGRYAPQWRTISGRLYDEQDLQPSPTVLRKFKKGSKFPASGVNDMVRSTEKWG
jgi:hypothetical protein